MSSLRAYVAASLFLLAAWAAPAHAGDKLRLERLDLRNSPTLRMYLSLVGSDGNVITGRAKEETKLLIDSADQAGATTGLQTFEETKETINLVVVTQVSGAMSDVLDDAKRGIRALADGLPPKSKMGLIGYATEVKRVSELGAPSDVESQAATMQIDNEGAETHLLDAVRAAIQMLAAAPPLERKMVVVFSDGIDMNLENRAFSDLGKRAADSHIVINTIGYAPFDASKLRYLSSLSRVSNGSDRPCRSPTDVSSQFGHVLDEVRKQYIATFEISIAGGDNKTHEFQVVFDSAGRQDFSSVITDKLPPNRHPPVRKGPRWWLWVLISLGGIAIIGVIMWAIFREKPEEEVSFEEPAAPEPQAPVAAPVPSNSRRTMAMDASAAGLPAMGWIIPINGNKVDVTFKLKTARTVIGTTADCDVCVDDQYMSARHAEVRSENGMFRLVDLGSTNGIIVNDKKVREHDLVDNDLIKCGRTEFKFKSIT